MRPPHILLVEDSPVQAHVVTNFLEARGYPVQLASTVKDALTVLRSAEVLLLDVVLPDGSGYEVLAELRSRQLPIKVLMLSQLQDVPQKVRGLKAGADDYLGKPFDLTELEARIGSLWRQHHVPQITKIGPWTFDQETWTVQSPRGTVPLTQQEFHLLFRLAQTPEQPVSRKELLRDVWKEESVGPRIVDVRVHGLRQKLGVNTIVSTRGFGYQLVIDPVPT